MTKIIKISAQSENPKSAKIHLLPDWAENIPKLWKNSIKFADLL